MTNKRLQFRRGTSAEHTTTNGGFTGAAGEITVDTTNTSLRVHDNSTAGGVEVARADLENISPDQAVNFNGQKLSNLAAPTSTTDAATKAYVDASFAGGNLSQLTDVSLGTLSAGELIAYSGSEWVNVGISGDATLNASGALTISDDAVTNAMLAADSVNTDQVVDSSITNAKIANSQIVVSDGSASSAIVLGSTLSFAGTNNQTVVSQSSGTVTVGLADDVTVAATLTVSGNLIVSGTTTTVNTATVSIQDNIMTLNSDATGTPTENAGLEIERGDSTNATLQWNETSDDWEVSIGGGTFYEIAHAGNANSVITSMITDANVTTAKIADSSITTAKIANDSVTSLKIEAGAVSDDHLADDAVTTIAILDANVTTAKIADDAITNAKIADDAVGAEHLDFLTGTIQGASGSILIGNGSSAFAELAVSGDVSLNASGAVTIGNSAVTTAKINDAAVTTVKLADSNVTTAKIADSNVTTAKILDANVTTAKIADSNVTTAKIADDAVTVAKIAIIDDTVVAGDTKILIGDGTDFSEFALSGDVSMSNTGAVSLSDDVVDTAELVDASVTTAKINDDAVTPAKINVINDLVTAGDTKILIGNGTEFGEYALSGDVTMTNGGAVSLSADVVDTVELVDSAVTTAKIADDAATPAKISVFNDSLVANASGNLLVTDGVNGFTNVAMSGDATLAANGAITIANSAVETVMIADANVTNAKMAPGSVSTSNIIDANVTNAKLATDAVNTANIVDDAVTQAKIAAGAVGTTELGTDSVTSAKITDSNVTTAKIADANVTTAKIADDAVTQAKISSGAGGSTELASGSVTAVKISGSSIGDGLTLDSTSLSVHTDGFSIVANTSGDLKVGDSSITTARLADSAVTTSKINSNAVTTDKVAAGAITTNLIADTNVTTGKIADGAVTSDKLAASLRNITFAADSGTADAVALGETISIIGTTNEIETAVTNNSVQVGLPNNVTVSNNLIVSNNLTVQNGDVSVGTDSSFEVIGLIDANRGQAKVLIEATNGVEIDGILRTDAGVRRMLNKVSGTVNVSNTHHVIVCTASATINLPSAGASTNGRELIIKNASGGSTVNITPAGADTAEVTSLTGSDSVTLICDGNSEWYSI